MKKGAIFILLVAVVLIFSGCFKKDGETNQKSSEESSFETNPIAELFMAGKKMKCAYTDKDTGFEGVTYYEGEKFRSEGEFGGKKTYTVSNGKVVYTWFDDKTGTKMDLECLEGFSSEGDSEQGDFSNFDATEMKDPQEMAELQQDFECEEVSNIDFSVPSDVEFQDMCAQMKQQMESLKQFQDQLPTGY